MRAEITQRSFFSHLSLRNDRYDGEKDVVARGFGGDSQSANPRAGVQEGVGERDTGSLQVFGTRYQTPAGFFFLQGVCQMRK